MQDFLPRNKHELELWKAFHPQAIYDPEKEEILLRANRRQLVAAYYGIDPEFAREMDKLMNKLTDKTTDMGELIEKIDKVIDGAEKRLMAATVKQAKVRKEEREKELIKLHKAFHP